MATEHGTTARRLNFGLRTAPMPTVLFLGGVFLTFAPLMFLTLRTGEPASWTTVAIAFTLSGICAVLWAMGGILSPKWFFVAVPAQIAVAFIVPTGLLGSYGVRSSGLDPIGLVSVVCIAVGYACFCVVIVGYVRRAIGLAVEMDLAAQIHRHLVPSIEIETDRYELAAESKPSGAMGGDVLHAVALPDGSIEAAVADVSGHGVRAGVVMAMVKATIESARGRVQRDAASGAQGGKIDGRRAVTELAVELNRVLFALTEPDMFVTAAIVHADPLGRVHAIVAAHPPILHRRGGGAALESIGGPALPLGVLSDIEPEVLESQLAPGDSLILYTDGLTEAIDRRRAAAAASGDAKAAPIRIGVDGLQAIVTASSAAPADQARGVLEGVAAASGPEGLDDDRSVLVLRMRE